MRKYRRASRALDYADRHGAPGIDIARFGRRMGVRLLRRGMRLGAQYLLTPVNITRYFEFEFALRNVRAEFMRCLDVSSPRLLGLYLADLRSDLSIRMLNPDADDAATTEAIAECLGYGNVVVSTDSVSALAGDVGRYDCIWSVSVVEHIAGDAGDTDAMHLMYGALRPGGRLIVTVPVDREFWIEYREHDYYGLHRGGTPTGQYFFSRHYDEASLRARLVEPLGQELAEVSWYGERVAGTFYAYERRWMEFGADETIEDPRRVADDYRRYERWADMPGFGVCAIVIDKPPGVESPLR